MKITLYGTIGHLPHRGRCPKRESLNFPNRARGTCQRNPNDQKSSTQATLQERLVWSPGFVQITLELFNFTVWSFHSNKSWRPDQSFLECLLGAAFLVIRVALTCPSRTIWEFETFPFWAQPWTSLSRYWVFPDMFVIFTILTLYSCDVNKSNKIFFCQIWWFLADNKKITNYLGI